MKAREVPYY